MTPSLTSLLGLLSNFTLFVLGMAVVIIALWQNPRATLNRYLALMNISLALWGIPKCLLYVAQYLDLNPTFLTESSATFYSLAMLTLFYFVTEFDRSAEPVKVFRLRLLISLWVALTVVLTWTTRVWGNFEAQADGSYHYGLTSIGFVLMSGAVFIALWIAYNLRNSSLIAYRAILVAVIPALLGSLPILLDVPIHPILNTFAVMLSMILFTRILLNDHVFNPLLQLYDELRAKNIELEKVGRLKSEFLANMSHELRTPLNSILGYTELLTSGAYGEFNEQQDNRTQKIYRNGKRLLELINNVLDLSKIEAERLELHPARINPTALLDDIFSTLQPLADEKGLQLIRHLETLPYIYVDEIRARQILLNVIANSIKFTPKGSVTVTGTRDQTRNQVVFDITDTGIGILPDDADKIFEAFQQVDPSTTREYEGSGLGLTVAKRLAELHGGRLWFESTPMQGSTFHIALPAASDSRTTGEQRFVRPQREDGKQPEALILVIDDDRETIDLLQDMLKPENFSVYGALTGREGLLRARELLPKLLILDIGIPDMTGWKVLELLQSDNKLKNIPVILVSAGDYSATLAREQGAVASLTKPLARRQLISAIHEAEQSLTPAEDAEPAAVAD